MLVVRGGTTRAIEESASSPFPSIVIVSRPRVVKHHMAGFCSVEETAEGGKVIYYIASYLRKSGLLHRCPYCSWREWSRFDEGCRLLPNLLSSFTGQIPKFVYARFAKLIARESFTGNLTIVG